MSIDTRSAQSPSRYGRVIEKFSAIRDGFDKAVKTLELLLAVDQLYADDREFLDEKLDELNVRAEEIRIEKLKKPEYDPPATMGDPKTKAVNMDTLRKRWNALDSKIGNVENIASAIEQMYSISPGLNAAIIGATGITRGDTMYGIDQSGEPIEFTVTSRRYGHYYLKDNETGLLYIVTMDNAEKYLTLLPEKKYLARLEPTIRLYKYVY